MKLTTVFFLVSLVAVVTQAATIDGAFVTGIGPVETALAGAGSATGLAGGNVMYQNPASIADVDREINFGISALVPDAKHQAIWTMDGVTVHDTGIGKSDTRLLWIPTLSYVHPLNDTITLGLGLHASSGLGADYGVHVYGAPAMSELQVAELAPAIAWKATQWLDLGARVIGSYATVKFELAGAEFPKESATGWGLHLGATAKVEKLAIGLSYRTKQDFDFDFGMMGDLGLSLPASARLGFAYSLPRITIMADCGKYWWSDTLGEGQPELSGSPLALSTNWDDQMWFAIAAEIAASDGLKIRLGYHHGENPLDAARAAENTIISTFQQEWYSIGAGIMPSEKLVIDFGLSYSPEEKLTGSNLSQGIISYESSLAIWTAAIGVKYMF